MPPTVLTFAEAIALRRLHVSVHSAYPPLSTLPLLLSGAVAYLETFHSSVVRRRVVHGSFGHPHQPAQTLQA